MKTALIVVLALGFLVVLAGVAGLYLQKRKARGKAIAPNATEPIEIYPSDRQPSEEVRKYLTVLKNACKGSSAQFREDQAMKLATPFEAACSWNKAVVEGAEAPEVSES